MVWHKTAKHQHALPVGGVVKLSTGVVLLTVSSTPSYVFPSLRDILIRNEMS